MKRLLIPAALAALTLAACGSDGGGNGSSNSTPAAAGSGSATVSIAAVDGTGDVLVDSTGNALYTPEEETGGAILCVEDCLAFWRPVAAGSAAPTAASGVPSLGVIDRSDGGKQVSVGGMPLYTFTQDSPGHVSGDGFADAFGGQHFTWHVVHSDGTIGAAPVQPMPTTPGSGGGGYAY